MPTSTLIKRFRAIRWRICCGRASLEIDRLTAECDRLRGEVARLQVLQVPDR